MPERRGNEVGCLIKDQTREMKSYSSLTGYDERGGSNLLVTLVMTREEKGRGFSAWAKAREEGGRC